MKRVMVLVAMMAIMLVAAAPAYAQTVYNSAVGAQFGHDNVQCVQNAVNQEAGKVQYTVVGDNVNIQAIYQKSNINTGVIWIY